MKEPTKEVGFLLFYVIFEQNPAGILVTLREFHKWLFLIGLAIQCIDHRLVTSIYNNTQ